jgi:hypothetical protein
MVKCDYCGKDAVKVTGKEVYPHRKDLCNKQFWWCEPCDAYVGCHRDGRPLGRLANAKLRRLRMKAHEKFDKIWQSGRVSRTEAYKLLAKKLGIEVDNCHIGMFNDDACVDVLRACKSINRDLNEPEESKKVKEDLNKKIERLKEHNERMKKACMEYDALIAKLDEAMASPEQIKTDTEMVGGFVSSLHLTETPNQIVERAIDFIKKHTGTPSA